MGLVKGAWTADEDRILLRCIEQGMTKWSDIAANLPGRIGTCMRTCVRTLFTPHRCSLSSHTARASWVCRKAVP
ncbi:MAG: hypothetical protein EOO41_05685 [Methanobacteriota archaeon]|nr:MAG: hypothetical protein EOO41_05685 [Euryarchaeota archaeon]